jgi:hypothetical protein
MERSGKNCTALVVAFLILIMAISVLVTAYGYSGGSGIFPRFIGWIFVGLTLIECLIQLKITMTSPTAGNASIKSSVTVTGDVYKEIKGFLWICFFLASLYLTGFLIGIPLYIFAFSRLSAGRSFKQCTIMSLVATIFVYVLFIELLQYRLYQGIIFGA